MTLALAVSIGLTAVSAAAYLRALRSARFAPTAPPLTAAGRRALRRALASGMGARGRLRALWAMPPWRA